MRDQKKWSIALVVIGFLFLPLCVHAFSLTPSKQTITVNPGDEQVLRLHIENNENKAVTLLPSVDAFAIDAKRGTPIFGAPDQAVDWVSPTTASVTLVPRSSADVLFSVLVPKSAEPGSHALVLLLQTKSEPGQITVSARLGSLLYLVVSGKEEESLVVGYAGMAQPVFFHTPIDFNINVRNAGTVHVIPQGDVVLVDMWNREVSRRPINPQPTTVLPKGTFERTISFENVPWTAIGHIVGYGTMRYGVTGRTVSFQVSFWYLPWYVLVLGVSALGAAVLLIKRVRWYE